MPRRTAVLLVLALLAAGCGVRTTKSYTAKGSAPCLRQHGFSVTTDPAKIGFIAAFAANGGLRAISPHRNVLTIAFAADAKGVPDTEKAFRDHAPAALRPHLADIMSSQRNAVLVWTTTPSAADATDVQFCLKP